MKKPNTEKLQAECNAFNDAHPVGSEVLVRLDGVDEPFLTRTRSFAEVLSGHTPVIWLENVAGCYLLDRVTPIPPSTEAKPAFISQRQRG